MNKNDQVKFYVVKSKEYTKDKPDIVKKFTECLLTTWDSIEFMYPDYLLFIIKDDVELPLDKKDYSYLGTTIKFHSDFMIEEFTRETH